MTLTEFEPLPWHDNADGKLRRIGVEMEMAGVSAEAIGHAVVEIVGGRQQRESAFLRHVRDASLGDFRVELDADVLTSRAYLKSLRKLGIDIEPGQLRENLETAMSRVAGLLVPHELVCPPVAFEALPKIDAIRAGLNRAGARGTHSSALYAFGLQFNIEVHSFEAADLLAVLRAFFLCFDEIIAREGIDFSRKLTPFVQRFPENYIEHVLDPDYAPDPEQLIDDYLRFTPTRNRPLDLLPLFAWLDEDRVMAAPVERRLIKKRPTWHYRLPNCLIDDPDWTLARPWLEWARIERLAADPESIERLSRRRLSQRGLIGRGWSALKQRLAGFPGRS
ncbi:MAG: amidoligase family protein [Wenzhouxiangellaceae bacterium]|nr:amidoligase family protein [Wenzhouxiangellaceae bacterium]